MPSQEADRNSGANAILAEVRAILCEIGLAPEDVAPSARLVDDLELDSLDWVDLALRLETALSVELHDERLASLATVGDVADLVRERLNARGDGRG